MVARVSMATREHEPWFHAMVAGAALSAKYRKYLPRDSVWRRLPL